jgi:hypothetical protein
VRINTTQLRDDVARGAQLLDRDEPNWVDGVDLTRLRMYHVTRCVLGQTYGDYVTGCDVLGLSRWSNDDATNHGFFRPRHGRPVRFTFELWVRREGREYRALDRIWRTVIWERRARRDEHREDVARQLVDA